MSKTIIKIASDQELRQQIRGEVPLRRKQVHQDRREKRQSKWWKDNRNWDN